MRFISVLLLSIFLAGCAGKGFLNTNTPADAGEEPKKYEERILNHLNRVLKDPDSMKNFSVSKPMLTSCAIGIYGPFNAWRVAVQYNAKNSYGAYVGLQSYYYWFHGERLKGINQNHSFCPEASAWI